MTQPAAVHDYQLNDMKVRSGDAYALAKYEILLEWLKPFSKMRILNAGCGSGELSRMLADAGHEVVGIDSSEEHIKLARSLSDGRANCSFTACALEKYKSERLFDSVVATDVLEHIADDGKAVKSLVSFLKPGGWLVVTVPAGQWMFGFHDEMLGHFRRYSCGGLSKLLRESVDLVNGRYFGFFLVPVCLWYSKIVRREYPVNRSRSGSWFSSILSVLLSIEKMIKPPTGTSLLMMGRLRA